MSISFSGLASGLDTSSWVESLTALKRAKVETYKAEKEKLVLTQQTLASIKNFFNSFRSVVEKVTDSRLCLGGSLDLFAQNLAISSKANVLTATATTEAQEGIYNIDIKNLATNTQASSNYSYITTQTVTATATLGSTLGSLGVKAGNIGVTVNGIERTVKIGNDETIQSFIEKMNNVGAKSSYNESTGIFNINISTSDIRDIGNTGIVNALHLKGVNEGYTSNVLQKPLTETVIEQATSSTRLSELGIQSGNITLASTSDGSTSNFYVGSTMTLGSLIESIKAKGYDMQLSDDGCITLTGANITNDGTTGLLKALGWDNSEVVSSTQTSNRLQYSTTITEGTVANRNTRLKDIATVNNGDTIVVKNSANVTKTITLSQTSTIGNVLDSLNSAGLYANISSDGVVSISDGTIVGGTFDISAAFNLSEQTSSSSVASKPIYTNKTVAQDVTSTANITYTVVRDIQLTDNVVDFCPELSEVSVHLRQADSSNVSLGYRRIEDSYTFQDLFNDLKNMGVEAKLENGVITVTPPEGTYITGLEPLGINVNSGSSSSTVTVASTRTSGTLYYTSTATATLSDKICDFINMDQVVGPKSALCAATGVYDKYGNTLDVIYAFNGYSETGETICAATTFEDVKNKLATCGITMTMSNGIIYLTSSNGAYLTGDLCDKLGIQTNSTGGTTTKGAAMSSSALITYTAGTELVFTPITQTSSPLSVAICETTPVTITNSSTMGLLFNLTGSDTYWANFKVRKRYDQGALAELEGGSNNTRPSVSQIIPATDSEIITYNVSFNADTTVIDFINMVSSQTGASIIASITPDKTAIGFRVGYSSSTEPETYLGVSLTKNKYIYASDGLEDPLLPSTVSYSLKPEFKTLSFKETLVAGMSSADVFKFTLTELNDQQISLGKDYNITLIRNDGLETILNGFDGRTTLGEVATTLKDDYGILLQYNQTDGTLTLKSNTIRTSPTDEGYTWAVKSFGSYIESALKIETGEGYSYNIDTENITTTATADTTFIELGLTVTKGIKVMHNGSEKVILLNAHKNIQTFIDRLSECGITAKIENGMFTIEPSDTSYITSLDNELRDVLKLGSGSTYKTEGGTTYTNTNSNQLTKKVTGTIDGSQIISDAHCGEIQLNYQGKTEIIYASNYITYNDVLDQLEGFGFNASITNGKITISSSDPKNVYITNFGGAFGMYGSGYTTSTKTTGTSSNTSSNRLQKEETLNATWDTTMGEIGLNEDGRFFINNKNSYNGMGTQIVKISSTDTLRDVREKLAMYDIAMDLSNGKVTFRGLNGAYIDGGVATVGEALNLSTIKSDYYTVTRELINENDSANVYLEDLYLADGTTLDSAGKYYLYVNGARHQLTGFYSNDTLDMIRNEIEKYGVTTSIKNGVLTLSAPGDVYLTTEGITSDGHSMGASSGIALLGLGKDNWKRNTSYKSSSPIGVTTSTSQTLAANRDTKLSDMGVTTGEYLLYRDGVKYTMFVSSDDTLGDFLNTLRSYGIESNLVTEGNATTIKIHSDSNSYIAASANSEKSNIIEKLFGSSNVVQSKNYSGRPEIERTETHQVNADEDTKLADITTDFIKPGEKLQITIDDATVTLNIDANETISSLIDKFNSLGLNASFTDGKMVIQSGYNNLNIQLPSGKNYLTYSSDLGGYSATDSNRPITSTEVIVEQHDKSAANYADHNTKLNLLNITSGTLNIYRNGEKAEIIVDSEQTFGDLGSKISAKFSDVKLSFENGKLKIASTKGDVVVGTTTDSSNFAAITGMSTNENGESVSSRALYRVNNSSKVTTSGLFVRGNITAGNFIVGDTTITIDKDTTIDDIISQINYNDKCQATAYWDSIDGKFVIKSKKTGASMINIEAGTSNFTDILGLTSTKDGKKVMNTDAQELGKNAVFTINGTRFTSTSNTVDSSISRIQGVTLNLKDVTEGETVTLKIEKDKETVATAMSDIVDAYNELIENIDKEVARGANLSGESTLKLIRNQIRSLMTSSISNSGQFRNLASVGIKLSAASSGNIRTDNINTLSFDKDKFTEAFGADLSSLKSLLVGTQDAKGILTQVEDILEQTLGGVTGYFASAEKSYNTKISRLDDKIEKANKAADRYKMRLEAKFKSMDMLISKYQNNYSSFLGK